MDVSIRMWKCQCSPDGCLWTDLMDKDIMLFSLVYLLVNIINFNFRKVSLQERLKFYYWRDFTLPLLSFLRCKFLSQLSQKCKNESVAWRPFSCPWMTPRGTKTGWRGCSGGLGCARHAPPPRASCIFSRCGLFRLSWITTAQNALAFKSLFKFTFN